MSLRSPQKPTNREQRALLGTHSTTRTPSSYNNHNSNPNEPLSEDHSLDLRLKPISSSSSEKDTSLNVSISDVSVIYPSANAQQPNSVLYSSNHHEDAKIAHEAPGQKRPIFRHPALRNICGDQNWEINRLSTDLLALGLVLSLLHHFSYQLTDGEKAGDLAEQASSLRSGTAFAFFICIIFQAATAAAFQQYLWIIVRRTSLKISSLDDLFTMTRYSPSFMSIELLKRARGACLFGIIFWCLGLTVIIPPATLSIIPRNITVSVPVAVMNFSQPSWIDRTFYKDSIPNAIAVKLATQAATNIDTVSITPPVQALEWSYDLTFYGPSVQCSEANSTQQSVFNTVTSQFEEDKPPVFVYSEAQDKDWTDIHNTGLWLLFSAWTPSGGSYGPNQWLPSSVTPNCESSCPYAALQIWIQTSTASFVCNTVNASFSVTFGSKNGTQYVTQRDVHVVENAPPDDIQDQAYSTHFWALSNILAGNISTQHATVPQSSNNLQLALQPPFSNILSTGLIACSDIQESPFRNISIVGNFNTSQAFDGTFNIEPRMCRNGTLARAIEDLANNITLSYFSSTELTDLNSTFRNFTTSDMENVYKYSPLYLLLTYGIAFGAVSVAVALGLWASSVDGPVSAGAFSGVMMATRNGDLDALVKEDEEDDEDDDVKDVMLKYGILVRSQGNEGREHLTFGLESTIREAKTK